MIKILVEDFKRLIGSRRLAYRNVFKLDDAYAQQVLADLAKFCRAHTTTFSQDARLHAVAEGRREVWLRIQEYLQLNEEQIYKLHRVHEYGVNAGETTNGSRITTSASSGAG